MPQARALQVIFFTLLIALICRAQTGSEEEYVFTNGPLPDTFELNQRYPNRPENVECRPIRLHIARNSRRYRTELVTNSNPHVQFAHADARVMSTRLSKRLNQLAELFYENHSIAITVQKAWTEFEDGDVNDPLSLHYEGRTVRVSVPEHLVSSLLRLGVRVGFDWVQYADPAYARLSVIPDACGIPLDLVFILDQSSSVGPSNHAIAIQFLKNVVSFFSIARNATQVGLVTYSEHAAIQFDLNDYHTQQLVEAALDKVVYKGGWTATALGLRLARWIHDPARGYGARPFSDGIPKVAVLITDGKSNLYTIDSAANNLRNFGVQVFAVGVGNIYLPELLFIASDPDAQHIFLLNSFNDAEGFVDFLSFSTCDSPAIVDPGDNTTSEIEEDEFRFFQSQCAAFSQTVMIEQIDLVGRCSLYASTTVPNPGPLDPNSTVVRNETQGSSSRFVHLNLPYVLLNRFVYVSVRGNDPANTFSIVIWDNIFKQDDYTISVPAGVSMPQEIINLRDELVMTDATFTFSIVKGNEDDLFTLSPNMGILQLTKPIDAGAAFELKIVAQNVNHSCHKARVIVRVEAIQSTDILFPQPSPTSVSEKAGVGVVVTTVTAIGSGALIYSIIGGNTGTTFKIDPQTGEISVAGPLDFETLDQYSLDIQVTNGATTRSIVLLINVQDENEPPEFVTSCAISRTCDFPVDENRPTGTVVGEVVATDTDNSASPNGMLVYSLEPSSAPFAISSSGVITTTQPLDHEGVRSYILTVRVRDGGSPSLSIESPVVVQVINQVENTPPVFSGVCQVDVNENIDANNPVLQCVATDVDEQGNEDTNLVYEITAGNTNDTFQINPTFGPGVIVAMKPIDREQQAQYVLTITATDSGGLSNSTQATINILDRNDNPPKCSPPTNPVTITDPQLKGHNNEVTTIVATDADEGANAVPVFAIESTTISTDSTSAVVTVRVTDSLDATLTSTCTLNIQFERECAIQQYAINSSSGAVTSELLCSATIEQFPNLPIQNSNRQVFCRIVRNIPTSYRWLHNGTAIGSLIPLSDSDLGALLLLNINFNDSGDYVCRAESSIGSLESEAKTLSVVVPATITTPPTSVSVELGRTVQFTCVAFGIPDVTYSWSRTNGGVVVPVTTTNRILVSAGSVVISAVEAGDQGEYTCSVSNDVSTATESASLIIFGLQQLVVAEIDEYSMPSNAGSCHEFNTTDFNVIMTSITGYTTITTTEVGVDLCPPSSCNPSPCQNRGTCQVSSTSQTGYVCMCTHYFTGALCTELNDLCTETFCENGGLCSTSPSGDVTCTCPDGFHGSQCQYTSICTTNPCPSDQMCVETVTNHAGYVCHVIDTVGMVAVVPIGDVSLLDSQVNTFIELNTDQQTNNRKKRAPDNKNENENTFVTVCEARFIRFSSSSTYFLIWACPAGVPEPTESVEELICRMLLDMRLVASCTSPGGQKMDLLPPTTLDSTRVNITFILVDPNTNRVLDSAEVLDILQRTDALKRLQTTNYKVTDFSAVETPTGSKSSSDDTGKVAGAVVGVVLACLILTSIAMATICILQHKRRDKRVAVLNKAGASQVMYDSNGKQGSDDDYIAITTPPPLPLKQAFTFPSSSSSLSSSPPSHRETSPLFDDPIYNSTPPPPPPPPPSSSSSSYRPPEAVRVNRIATLERGVKRLGSRVAGSLRRGVSGGSGSGGGSAVNLLSDSDADDVEGSGYYEEVVVEVEVGEGEGEDRSREPDVPALPPRVRKPFEVAQPVAGEDEVIYGNLDHQKVGAMGNAGQRWESYWKTETLFRTDIRDLDPSKK